MQPIRALHRGASRVAAGDFDYRVEHNTHDEISHLAVAFNHMTERFQSVTADLDREVQQQSRQLVQSAKLAGVGFLAAGVAHEINNPLHAISTAAEGLQFQLSRCSRTRTMRILRLWANTSR
ncbi:MAG: HAMP domain-containing protein [Planctomycetaceae bacterium]